MTSLFEFAERLETAISEVISETAAWMASEIKRTTPANRTETRRAVFYRARGLKSVIGLRFSKRYPAGGTATQKLLVKQQHDLKPRLQKRLIESINKKLQDEN